MGDLRDSIQRLRAIPALWKHLADPIGELARIRRDPDYNPYSDPKWADGYEVGSHEEARCSCYQIAVAQR